MPDTRTARIALNDRGLLITANPATLRRAEALDAGCDACFSKPFKIDDLIASIRLSTRAAG